MIILSGSWDGFYCIFCFLFSLFTIGNCFLHSKYLAKFFLLKQFLPANSPNSFLLGECWFPLPSTVSATFPQPRLFVWFHMLCQNRKVWVYFSSAKLMLVYSICYSSEHTLGECTSSLKLGNLAVLCTYRRPRVLWRAWAKDHPLSTHWYSDEECWRRSQTQLSLQLHWPVWSWARWLTFSSLRSLHEAVPHQEIVRVR